MFSTLWHSDVTLYLSNFPLTPYRLYRGVLVKTIKIDTVTYNILLYRLIRLTKTNKCYLISNYLHNKILIYPEAVIDFIGFPPCCFYFMYFCFLSVARGTCAQRSYLAIVSIHVARLRQRLNLWPSLCLSLYIFIIHQQNSIWHLNYFLYRYLPTCLLY